MEKVDYIWYNGQMINWDDAKTHLLTHTLHYGTGVFEGIRAYKTDKGPAIFRLKEHIDRLFESARIAGIKVPYTNEEIFNACKQIVKENNLEECYIRPLIFYGSGKMGLDTIGARVDVMVAAWKWGAYLGEEGKKNGINGKISKYTRDFALEELNHVKATGWYMHSMLAKMDALNTGYNEAIMLDREGNVAECSGENIFIINDNKIITPSINNCLIGITRNSVIDIAKNLGYEVEERTITKEELMNADGCFLTGTAAEITPIKSIDRKELKKGVHEIAVKIQKEYDSAVRGKERYSDWLELVE